MRYRRADLVLYLNFPRWLCYIRVFKRIFDKSIEIDDRAEDCPEKASWRLLKYMWTFDKRVEKIIADLRDKYPDVRLVEIRNNRILQNLKLSL